MAVMKVKTYITTSVTASPLRRAEIPVIMDVETFIIHVIASIGNIIMCLT